MSELIFKNVYKSFLRTDSDEITNALSDISFSAKSGEFVSIVGPSGCGKSTILRLISGLTYPTRGEILLDNKPVEETSSERSMVFQSHNLFPWLTVGENVAFSGTLKGNKEVDEAEVDRLLKKVGLYEFKNLYPSSLSGGMAQRVSLIRTMVTNQKCFY